MAQIEDNRAKSGPDLNSTLSPRDGEPQISKSQRLIEHARLVNQRVSRFFAAFAALSALETAEPALAASSSAISEPISARGQSFSDPKPLTEFQIAAGDSIGLGAKISGVNGTLLGAADSRGRAGIGLGRLFAIDREQSLGRFFIGPEVWAYGQYGAAPRADIGVRTEWHMNYDTPDMMRYQMSLEGVSSIIVQKGSPMVTRVEQTMKSHDSKGRGFLPIEQGALIRLDYSARGDDSWSVVSQSGDTYVLNRRRFNTESWFFATWRVGPGIAGLHLGMTQSKNPKYAEARLQEDFDPLHPTEAPYKTTLLWRVKYSIRN